MSTKKIKEEIILGSGKNFAIECRDNDYDLSTDEGVIQLLIALENDENKIGDTKGGATIAYSVESFTVTDDLGKVSRTRISGDSASLKLGLLAKIRQEYLTTILGTARRSTGINHMNVNRIGGIDNDNGKKFYWAFINYDEEGDTLVIVKGINTAGLSEQFQVSDGITIEPEITAESLDKDGTKILILERTHGIPNTELSTQSSFNITFYYENASGEQYVEVETPNGELPVAPEEATRSYSRDNYSYAFQGWNPGIVKATGDADYHAVYTETAHTEPSEAAQEADELNNPEGE